MASRRKDDERPIRRPGGFGVVAASVRKVLEVTALRISLEEIKVFIVIPGIPMRLP